ncbi:MAG: hypothetical protein LQ348_007247 [Seirophora lacunosa]|nr:MAG: hypothetical protein LQ348_007247 [Seirophora lacunosa]
MARVPAKRAAAAPVRTGALRHARTNEQRKSSYKVVIEEITEKKKKLHTTVSFRTQAPLGYTFVAAGDPRLTSKCKDIARAQSLTVYIVSTSRSNSLSEQVGRLGYHFPSTVVEQACQSLRLTLPKSGTLRLRQGTRQQPQRGSHRATRSAHNKNDQITKPRAASVGNDMDQSEIDARAAFAIRDLFPKIPERDVQLIVAQAFQKGTNKVGTAFDQPHIRRVHLAVGAYIRHSYTDYDKLLKTHGYFEARHMVEPFTLDKIIEWRDEKDDPDAVEDILREVIVISDDEDEDLSEEGHFGDRDSSVEIASSREISNEVHVQPIDYGTLDGRSRLERPVSPEDDWAPSVRFIRRLSTPPAESKQQQDRIARHHAQRYQKWQDAISRSRRKDMENTGHSRMAEPIGFTGPGPPPAIHRIREPIMVDHDGNGYPPGFTDSKAASRQDAFRRTTLHIPHTDGMNRNVPTYDGATNVSWPAYHTNHTEDRNGDNKLLPYRPSGAIPRSSSIAGPVYLDSERLIPSVESDSPTALMHKDYLTNSRPAAPQRHFQDHMIGPRVVEIDDDPLSPTHKRRRIADDGSSPAKVMYSSVSDQRPALGSTQPSAYGGHSNPGHHSNDMSHSELRWDGHGTLRTTELVPIADRVDQYPNVGAMGDNTQRRTRLVTQEHRAPGAFPKGRLEYQQPQASPPVHSHSQFPEVLPARQLSGPFLSRPQPVLEMDESSRPLRPVYANGVAPYTERLHADMLSKQVPGPAEHGSQRLASRLEPSCTADQYRRMDAYDRPAAIQAVENPTNTQASMAKTQKLTSRPPVQDKQHSSNVLSHPLSSKLDCPFAIQGSFCDRLRQNGFSTPDHLNEHLRKVHLWDMQKTRGLDDVRASDLSHNPLGSHVASQNSYVHAERMHTDPRAGWRTDTYPKTNREQEAIYVSSSPLVEEW